MNTPVKKVVVGKPIENLLKNSPFLQIDASTVNDSLARLQALRQTYIQSPDVTGKQVFKLPPLKK